MGRAEMVYKMLRDDFGLENATGKLKFNLRDFSIMVEQNNVVGNILEEWICKWMINKGIPHIHNTAQESPDFWLNPEDLQTDWLEVKSFTASPNFDVAAFRSFINIIIEKPWKLYSKYLLIKYKMEHGEILIENFWLKNLWEICSTSNTWPLKVQYRNKVIVNIRPATWYSTNPTFKAFEYLEDFLAALEETIYMYHDTRSSIAETWAKRLCSSYKKHYNKELILPRWNDIKHKYVVNI